MKHGQCNESWSYTFDRATIFDTEVTEDQAANWFKPFQTFGKVATDAEQTKEMAKACLQDYTS